MNPTGRDRFLELLRKAVHGGSLVKLTLGKASGDDPNLTHLYLRPVVLKAGPKFALLWRYKTRDITKNLSARETLRAIEPLIGADFRDAHLFTTSQRAQLETGAGKARLTVMAGPGDAGSTGRHDRPRARPIQPNAGWLRALGVTSESGSPAAGMADKFRQIEKYAEILGHLLAEAEMPAERRLRVFDMGCGKGYLTFAASEMLGERAVVQGVEARPDLVVLGNQLAADESLGDRLSFQQGSIAQTDVGKVDILIALHACDTATDDALAKGVEGGAALLVVAPCCHKEVRPQIIAPDVLSGALRHGIFREREAEFVTDALRAQLLEWAGYRTKVFEFISTEHTAKNTMITAVRGGAKADPAMAARIRALAGFYGIKRQALAAHFRFPLQ
ncbi:MAG TPA: SAM-dependent methyltransferase [Opitutaceae bacterium]